MLAVVRSLEASESFKNFRVCQIITRRVNLSDRARSSDSLRLQKIEGT